MKTKILFTLFVISILINVFFVGILSGRVLGSPRPHPPKHDNLGTRVREIFKENPDFRKEITVCRKKYFKNKGRFLQELRKPEIDKDKLESIMQDMIDSQIELERVAGKKLILLREKMTSEKAKIFFKPKNLKKHLECRRTK